MASTFPPVVHSPASLTVVDAIDALRHTLQALRAVEQLLGLEGAAATAGMPAVQRADLAALLGVVNAAVDGAALTARSAALAAGLASSTPPAEPEQPHPV